MATLSDLVAAHPTRIGMLTVVPLVLATAQLTNAIVYGLPLELPVGFSVVMVLFAAASLVSLRASFRVTALEDRWLE